MKKDDLNRMISLIDDEKLAASEKAGKPKFRLRQAVAIAACLSLLLSSALILPRVMKRDYIQSDIGYNEPVNKPAQSEPPQDQPDKEQPPDKEIITSNLRIISTSATAYHSSGLIANNTGFVIKTENGTKEMLEKSIYLDPPVEYTIEELETDSYLLTPSNTLPDNTLVSLAQVKDKKVTESWAYQTKKELTVSGTYPRDGAEEVAVNSVIEIVLSYSDVENFSEYVSITPEVSGTWEHIGKTWRLKPDKPLSKDTLYKVDIRAGFKNEIMTNTEAVNFSFSTFAKESRIFAYSPLNASADDIFTFRPEETVKFGFVPENNGHIQISRIALEQFKDADEFLKKLENQSAQAESTELGDAHFTWQNLALDSDIDDTVVLSDNLPEGYYSARIYDMAGRERSTVFFQINRISAYALETLHEALIWTAKDKELAEGLTVSYNGSTEVTDKDGIARFKAHDGDKIIYAKVGETNPLVIGFVPIKDRNYEYINGYIYTDRALYRENDLIQIWGYIPPEMIGDGGGEVYVKLEIDYTASEKIPVTLDEFGCFTASYRLSDYRAGDLRIYLYYNNTYVDSRTLEIKNYAKQYYSYEILPQKNYLRSGEVIEFDVKVNHISNASVEGKRVYACGKPGITDENGIAHFSMTTDELTEDYYNSNQLFDRRMIIVKNGDGTEISSYQTIEYIYVFKSDIALLTKYKEENVYTVSAYKINLDSDISILKSSYSNGYLNMETLVQQIGTPIENAEIHVTLRELKYERYIHRYEYDEYTNTYTPIYEESGPKISELRQWTLTAKNGSTDIDISDITFKGPEEMIKYFYDLIITADDSLPETIDIYKPLSAGRYPTTSDNPYPGYLAMEAIPWLSSKNYMDAFYNKFSYQFSSNINNMYTFGEEVSVELRDRYNNTATDGTVLRVLMHKDIVDDALVAPDKLSFNYPEEMVPNMYLTGAYFKDGVFYRIPGYCLFHDKAENELEVEVSQDREEYAPGDTVTLEIDVKNAAGNGVFSEVSLSIVDEAALALGENDTYIAENIFSYIRYPRYFYSSYQDLTLTRKYTGWGGGNGRNKCRSNFADTAYFGTVITDEDGHARVTFTLPDTVTSYSITAHAAGKKIHVGVGKSTLTVKKDFFIQHTEPRGVKATDDLVVGACGIGTSNKVSFTFTLKETGQQISVSAGNSVMAYANFGKLPLGAYTVQIDAVSGGYSDSIEYTVNIISTAQAVRETTRTKVSDGQTIEAVKSPVVVEICNTDMARYRAYLDYLRSIVNERLDTQIANREAAIFYNYFYNENTYVPYIDYMKYEADIKTSTYYGHLYAPLKNAEADIIFTALAAEYLKTDIGLPEMSEFDPFESALLRAVKREAILKELSYLADKAEDDREKLLISLSYAYLGDYANARENYVQTNDRYLRSLQAMAATFIDRENAAELLDELISDIPADKYLRFAVMSYLKKNTELIEREETVTVTSGEVSQTVTVNGLEVKRLVFNKEQISDIKFTASSENIDVVYYYDTASDRLSEESTVKDLRVYLKSGSTVYTEENKLTVNDIVTLNISYSALGDKDLPCSYITVALPNNLRMIELKDNTYGHDIINKEDHIIIQMHDSPSLNVEIPLYVVCEGEYTFEPVAIKFNDKFHISEPFVYSAEASEQ